MISGSIEITSFNSLNRRSGNWQRSLKALKLPGKLGDWGNRSDTTVYGSIGASVGCQDSERRWAVRQQPTNCLSVFDHFPGLALKRLIKVDS